MLRNKKLINCHFFMDNGSDQKTLPENSILFFEVISKVIQKMAFDAIRKELQRVVCTCCL